MTATNIAPRDLRAGDQIERLGADLQIEAVTVAKVTKFTVSAGTAYRVDLADGTDMIVAPRAKVARVTVEPPLCQTCGNRHGDEVRHSGTLAGRPHTTTPVVSPLAQAWDEGWDAAFEYLNRTDLSTRPPSNPHRKES